MDTCDVLIVGGGPAGSSCALRLRQAGLDVVLMDKSRFPRDKRCAGWITPAVVETLSLDIAEYAAGRVLQPISGFRTGLIGSRMVTTTYSGPISFGIRRCEFDHYLVNRSQAQLIAGAPVTTIRRTGQRWIVNEAVTAPVLVGAGGHFCPVARWLNPDSRAEPIVAAQEVEFEIPIDSRTVCRVEAQIPELYFCRDLRGYGWCFRKENVLNVGFGRQHRSPLSRHVSAFMDFLGSTGRCPQGVPGKWPGHAYLLHEARRRRIVGDGVMLIGDAAGLAYSQSGEGIGPAVESGLLAAKVILEADRQYASEWLMSYAQEIDTRFATSRASRLMAALVPRPLVRALAVPLLGSRWFTRHMLLDRAFLHVGTAVSRPVWPDHHRARPSETYKVTASGA